MILCRLVQRLDSAGLLPDDVYGRSAAGVSVTENCWRGWLGDAPAAGNFSACSGRKRHHVCHAGAELATIHSSVQQASALVPDYGSLMAWRIVALALALCCWIVPQVKGYQPAVPLLSVAFILLLVGELIGRGVFYGLHMTVGMAVAS